MATRSIVVVLALTVATTAAAEPLTPPGQAPVEVATPPARAPHRFELQLVAGLRVTALDGAGRRFVEDAIAYGWRGAANRPMPSIGVEARYLFTPLIDVGAAMSWRAADVAAGFDDSDRMRVRLWEVSATARLRWAGGRPFVPEPRLDVGLGSARMTVHDVADVSLHRFVRLGVDWRLGVRRAGVAIAVGYTLAHVPVVDGPAPPRGGLDLGVGPYLRF